MRMMELEEKEVRTVLAVFEKYDELNLHLGSLTIDEMYALDRKMAKWYKEEDEEDEIW